MIKALPLPHSLLGPNSGLPYGSSSLWCRMGRACSSHTSLHALFPVRVGKRKAENRSLLPRLSKVSVLSVDRDSGLPVGWWPLQPLLLIRGLLPSIKSRPQQSLGDVATTWAPSAHVGATLSGSR